MDKETDHNRVLACQDAHQFVGKAVGDGQCVALIKQYAYDIPIEQWVAGQLKPVPSLPLL